MENKIVISNENKTLEITKIDDMFLELNDHAHLILKILNIDNNKNIKISAKVGQNSELIVIFADFSKDSFSLQSCVDLVGENASCKWHLATLSNDVSKKVFDVSFNHDVGHTDALMDNYGVARGKSSIVFTGCNHIKNGSVKSSTNQVAKIIVFDKEANGVASPILRIDENDVNASHSAVVGQLNSDHMFYLMSRGLNKEEARELITRGYLQPIVQYFNEVNKQKIELAIKEELSND